MMMKYLPKRYILLNDSIMFLHAFYIRMLNSSFAFLIIQSRVQAFKKQFSFETVGS